MFKAWVWSLASNIMKEIKCLHVLSSVVRVGRPKFGWSDGSDSDRDFCYLFQE